MKIVFVNDDGILSTAAKNTIERYIANNPMKSPEEIAEHIAKLLGGNSSANVSRHKGQWEIKCLSKVAA